MKVRAKWQAQLIASVCQGNPLNNAAAVIGVGQATVILARKFDPDFDAEMVAAEAACLQHCQPRA